MLNTVIDNKWIPCIKNANVFISVHEDPSEDHWWRGCRPDHGEPLGCTQHNFYHHDHDELVDECVCKEALCNREMGPIETTTKISTTTIKGSDAVFYVCLVFSHLILNNYIVT